jgi:fibronectin-binding autotransporter adhesin
MNRTDPGFLRKGLCRALLFAFRRMCGGRFCLWPALLAWGALWLVPLSKAAPITFKTPESISGESDVLNAGTAFLAVRYWGPNNLTLNGVDFVTSVSTTGVGNLSISGGATYFNGLGAAGPNYNPLGSNYQQLVNGAVFVDGAGPLIVSLNGLTPSRSYALQIWANDSRIEAGAPALPYRMNHLASSGGNTVLQKFNVQRVLGGVGEFTVGSFVANASSQTFTLSGTLDAGGGYTTGASAQLNSIVVRDISSVWRGGVNGNWDTTTLNWGAGNAYSAAASSAPVVFGDLDGLRDPVATRDILIQSPGVSSVAGVVFNNSTAAYTLSTAGSLGLSGAGGLAKNGSNRLTISGTHTFAGAVQVNAGSLVLASALTLPPVPVTIASGAVMDLNGFDQELGTLTNNGTLRNSGGPLSLGFVWSGTLGNFNGSNVSLSVRVPNTASLAVSSFPSQTREIGNMGSGALTLTGSIQTAPTGFGLVQKGAGALTVSATTGGSGDLVLKTTGTNLLTVSGDLNFAGRLINAGKANAGSLAAISAQATQGAAIVTGALGPAITKVVQNSATSPLVLFAANANYAGPVEIQKGALVLSNKAFPYDKVAGTGVITVGTGSADAALVYASRYASGTTENYTLPNNLVIAGSGKNVIANSDYSMALGGTLTLQNADVILANTNPASVFGIFEFLNVQGGVVGTGTVTVTNSSGSGNTTVTFETRPVNHSGGILFNSGSVLGGQVGTGNGANSITGGIGPNVTFIQQDSDTNPLTISGGSVQVNPAGLSILSTGAASTTISAPTTGTGALLLSVASTGAVSVTGALGHTGGLTLQRSGSGAITLPSSYAIGVPFVSGGTHSTALSLTNAITASNPSLTQTNPNGALTLSGALTVGVGGKTIETSGAALTLSGAVSGSGPINLRANAAGILTMSGGLNVAGTITNSGLGNSGTLYSTAGTGPGSVLFTGALGSSVARLIQDSPSSALVFAGSSPSLSAPIEIRKGRVVVAYNAGGNALGGGTVYLGTGAADAALLYSGRYGSPSGSGGGDGTLSNPILVGGSGQSVIAASDYNPTFSGTISLSNDLMIASLNASGSTMTFTGGLTGTGNVTLVNASGSPSGASLFAFTTKPINSQGALTFMNAAVLGGVAGTNTHVNSISGGIGANVSIISQASSSNPLTITAGTVWVGAGGKTIRAAGADLTVSSPLEGTGNLTLENNASSLVSLSGALNFSGTLANSGTGSSGNWASSAGTPDGSVLLTGVLRSTVTRLVQDSPSSALVVYANNTGLTAPVEIRRGNLVLANNSGAVSNLLGSGTIYLGTGSANAGLLFGGRAGVPGATSGGGNYTLFNPIEVGGTGLNVIAATDWGLTLSGPLKLGGHVTLATANTAGSALTVNGYLSGTGNLVVSNASGPGSANVSFNVLINNAGSLLFNDAPLLGGTAGTSTNGNFIIAGGVGPNVTSITESSLTPLTISTGSITVGNSGLVLTHATPGASTAFNVSVPVNGSGMLTVNHSGAGPLTLSNTVTTAGGVQFNRTGSGALTVSGTLNTPGPIVNVSSAAGTLAVNGLLGASVTEVHQNGSNSTLNLSGNNAAFNGQVRVSAGTLLLGGASGNELGTQSNAGTLTVNGGRVNFGNYTAYTVGGLEGGGSLSLRNGTNAALVLTVGNSRNLSTVFSGSLSGTGTLDKKGAGTLTLSGVSIFAGSGASAGEIWFKGGTLLVSAGGRVEGLAALAGQTGGTLLITNGTVSMGSAGNFAAGYGISGTSYVTVGAGGVLNVGTGANAAGGKVFIAGGDSVGQPMGNGVLTITDNGLVNVAPGFTTAPYDSVYLGGYGGSGVLNLDGGTLMTQRNLADGTGGGVLNLNGGVLRAGTNALSLSTAGITARVKSGGAVIDTNGFNITIPKALTADPGSPGGGFRKLGAGSLTLSGTNTYTGGTTIAAGTLAIAGSAALGSGSLTITNADFANQTGLLDPLPAGMTQVWSGSVGIQSSTSLTFGSGTITLAADTTVLVKGVHVRISSPVTGTAGLSKSGPGTLVLSGTHTYSGSTTVLSGTLILEGPLAQPPGSALTVAANATVLLQGGAPVPLVSGAGTLAVTPGAVGVIGGGNVSGSSSVVLSGSSSLTKQGSGVVSLSQTSSFTGKTWIQSGTLSVSTLNRVVSPLASSSLGAPNSVLNGTIDLGSLTSTGVLTVTGTAQTTDRIINLAGTTGGGILEQAGTGALVFSGSVTATGAGSKTLTLRGAGPGTGEISGAIADNSAVNKTSLRKEGSGTWTLSGANTHSGGTTLVDGTLRLGHGAALGTGPISIQGGALENATASVMTLPDSLSQTWSGSLRYSGAQGWNLGSGSVQLASNVTAQIAAPNVTIPGPVFGSGSLTKDGPGTLVLAGNNTYTGATTVQSGTLVLDGPNALPANTALTVAAGAKVILQNGAPIPFYSGAGTVSIAPGTPVVLGTGNSAGSASLVLSGSSTLTKVGSETLVLSGSNAYTGKTWIQSGGLSVGSLNRVIGGIPTSALGAPSNAANGTIDLGSLAATGSLIVTAQGTAFSLDPPYTLSSEGVNPLVIPIDLGQTWSFEAEYKMNSSNGLNTVFSYGQSTDGILIRTLRGDSLFLRGTFFGTVDILGGENTGGQFVPVRITFDQGVLKLYAAGVLLRTMEVAGTLNPSDKTLRLGSAHHSNSEGLDGQIRNIRIYRSVGSLPSTTTDRMLNLAGTTGGAVLEQAGTDLVIFNGDITASGAGSKTLTLQGSTVGQGQLGGTIFDNSAANRTALRKQGTGTWTLAGTGSYSGGTTLVEGTLRLAKPGALGSGTLTLLGGVLENAVPNDFALPADLLQAWGGSFTLSGQKWNLGSGGVQVLAPTALQLAAPVVQLSGSLSGSGSLSLSGPGSLVLSGSNTLSAIQLNSGSLVILSSASAQNVPIQMGASARVSLQPQQLTPSGLIHRWSFSEATGSALNDSIGNAHGSIQTPAGNAANATLQGGSLRLQGGNKGTASYGSLPGSVLEGLTSTTIEVWASLDAVTGWPRIFDFGNGTNQANSFVVAFSAGTDLSRPAIRDVSYTGDVQSSIGVSATLGRIYHWALVWDAPGQLVKLYREGVYLCSFSNAGHTLAEIPRDAFWLGRAHFGDDTAQATYAEVRMWNRALTAAEVAASAQAGFENLEAGTLNVQTLLTGPGQLESSAGTVVLGGSNQHTGGTNVVAGTLVVTSASALGSGPVVVQAGAALELALNQDTSLSPVFSGSGALIKSGSGTVVFTHANQITGPIVVRGGSVQFNQLAAIASGSLVAESGAAVILNPTSDISLAAPISGTVLNANPTYRVSWNGGALGGPAPVIQGPSVVNAGQGLLFSHTLSATNGPVQFAVNPALPAGLSLNPNTGVISGFPGTSGEYPMTVMATNSGGSVSAAFKIRVERVPVTIAMNFADSASDALDSVTPKGPLGTVFWNANAPGVSTGTLTGLKDHLGRATPVGISWQASNTWRGVNSDGSQNGKILEGYLDDSPVNLTFSNIPYANYNVYGIVASDHLGPYDARDFRINDSFWVFGGANPTTAPAYPNWNTAGSQWVQINPSTPVTRGNYWKIAGMSGGTLSVVGQNASNGVRGSFAAILIEGNPGPTFTVQPLARAVVSGTSVTFTAGATGSGTIQYQWRKNGEPIQGGTSASYTLANVQSADAGAYQCVASDSVGSSASNEVQLSVLYPATISTAPTALSILEGGSGQLSVTATGTEPLNYEWKRNGAVLSGGTGAVLALSNASIATAGSYTVRVWNEHGSQTSEPVLVSVNVPATISSEPTGLSIVQGGGGQLSVTASGTEPLNYEWRRDGVVLSEGSGAVLALANAGVNTAGSYTVRVWNEYGSQTSSPVTVNVNYPPSLVLVPGAREVSPGATIQWSVGVTGTQPFTFSWFKNGNTPISVNAVTTSGGSSTLTLVNVGTVDAGSYHVTVSNMAGFVTTTPVRLTVGSPPAVLGQPLSRSVLAGSTGFFTVTASGTAPLSYQWRKAGVPISGGTSASLTLPNAQPTDAAVYDCVILNPLGSATSAPATLTVQVPPSIETSPTGGSVLAGGSLTLRVTAVGDQTLTYLWRRNGVAVLNGTNASLQLLNASVADDGQYDCVVSNAFGSVTSAAASVQVKVPPALQTPPQSTAAISGGSASFSVLATGTAPLSYQWRRNGQALPQATEATLHLRGLKAEDAAAYDCVITNEAGSLTSPAASLTVQLPPDTGGTVVPSVELAANAVTFRVEPKGTAPFAYQWRKAGVPLTGLTEATLTLSGTSLLDPAEYDCVITNAAGQAISGRVAVPVRITTQPRSQLIAAGGSLELSVQTFSAGSLSFQWLRNGLALPGAITPIYRKVATTSEDDGRYVAQISLGPLQIRSEEALVQQVVASVALNPSGGVTVVSGGSSVLSAHVLNSAFLAEKNIPLTFSWTLNGRPIEGAISPTLALSNVNSSNAGVYEVTARAGAFGSSSAKTIVQVADLTIRSQPRSLQIRQGDPVELKVEAAGVAGEPLLYQWRKAGVPIPNATQSTLSIANATSSDVAGYDVVITSGPARTVSQMAMLVVLRPVALNDPALFASQARALNPGQALSLRVSATGSEPITYQWFRDGQVLEGQTRSALNIESVRNADAGEYSVRISNLATDVPVQSPTVQIRVNSLPVSGAVAYSVDGGSVATASRVEVLPGKSVVLSLPLPPDASRENLTYSWRRNGVAIANATGAQLNLGAVRLASQEGFYDVVVRNAVGPVTWIGVQLALSERPLERMGDLPSTTVLSGSDLRWTGFAVTPAGPGVRYEWKRNGAPLEPSVSTAALELRSATKAASGTYSVTASTEFSEVSSSPARLIVLDRVQIQSLTGGGTLNLGQPASFEVRASGDALQFQWLRDGDPVPGATGAVFTLRAVTVEDQHAKFAVRVFNEDAWGRRVLSSETRTLPAFRVRLPVQLGSLTADAPLLLRAGQVLNLSIPMTGTGPFEVVWRKDGKPLFAPVTESGSVATATLPAADVQTPGVYDVQVRNGFNEAVSGSLRVGLREPVSIVQQPQGRSANTGTPVTLSVSAGGTGPFTYQWSRDGKAIAQANAQTLILPSLSESDEGAYSVAISDEEGNSVVSNRAMVAINDDVTILRQPQSPSPIVLETGKSPTPVVLSVQAETQGRVLRFQWRKDGQEIAGANAATLRIESPSSSDSGRYEVQVSSGASAVVSDTVEVEILPALSLAVAPAQGYPEAVPAKGSTSALVRLQAVASARGSVEFQWFRNGTAFGVGSEIQVEARDQLDEYRVVMTLKRGETVLATLGSSPVPVRLMQPVALRSVPQSTSLDAGGAAVFAVDAVGGGTVAFAWERLRAGRWERIAGASTRELRIPVARTSDSGNYRAVVSNARNSLFAEATLAVREPEVIVIQPTDKTVNLGDAALLEVKAAGIDLSYQWRRNGTPMSGANAAALSTKEPGLYDVLVQHAFGSSISQTVRVTVRTPVTIDRSPASVMLHKSSASTLLVKARGSEPLSYQWRKNGVPLANETEAHLLVTQPGFYDVLVTNPTGTVASELASVTIPDQVEIKVQPAASITARPGDTVQLTAVASGTPAAGSGSLEYQWQRLSTGSAENVWSNLHDGVGVQGAKTASLTLSDVQPDASAPGSARLLRLVVRGEANAVTTVPSSLIVLSPPVLAKVPGKAVVKAPGVAVFNVLASGTPPFTYRWFENGVLMTNPTTTQGGARLIVQVEESQTPSRVYAVEVSNEIGKVLSPAASLVVVSGQLGVANAPAENSDADSRGIRVINKGSTFTLQAKSVLTEDGVRLGYQWRKNGVDLPGATSPMLPLVAETAETSGTYEVVVKLLADAPGTENDGLELARGTQPATLVIVNPGPVIEPLSAQSVRPGQPVVFAPLVRVLDPKTLTLVPASAGSFTVAWSLNGQAITSGISASGALTLSDTRESSAGVYSARATVGGVTGDPVSVTLTVEPALQAQIESIPARDLVSLELPLEVAPRSRVALAAKVVRGQGPFRYQWRYNGMNVAGATAPRLSLNSVLARQSGRYDVVVSNGTERAVSSPIQLRVREALAITSQPPRQTNVNLGVRASLPVAVNRQDVTYQWYKGVGPRSEKLEAQTQNTLTFNSVKDTDEGSYRVVITATDGSGRLTSQTASVNVNKPPQIKASPTAPTVPVVPGNPVSFSVSATGTGPLSYQWTRNGVEIPGANAEVLVLSAVTPADAGAYRAIVRSPYTVEGVASEAAQLTVSLPVTITRQPLDQSLNVGDKPTPMLSVEVSGSGKFAYQWRRNGLDLANGKSASLTPPKGVTFYDTGNYDVVVTNTVGDALVSRVVSRTASVRVSGAPPADEKAEINDGWRANEGETVLLPSYAESANWTRVQGGTSSLDPDRTKGASGGSVLTLRQVRPSDAGVYLAQILSNGTVTGKSVRWVLDVVPVPLIKAEPKDAKVLPGGETLVSAGVDVTDETRFQWYFQSSETAPWIAVPGANKATYVIRGATARDGGWYRLEVSNSAGTVSSRAARVTVYAPVSVRAELLAGGVPSGGSLLEGNRISGGSLSGALVAQSANPGSIVTLRAMTSGDLLDPEDTAFQWYRLNGTKTWTAIPGAVSRTITFTAVQEAEDAFYRVRAFGKANGGVDSDPIRLVVNDPVAFKAGQTSRALALVQGEAATLSVNVTGWDVHYQWSRNGQPIGTDSPTLLIPNASALDSGTYGVILSNAFSRAGATASTLQNPKPETAPFEVARVTVQTPPTLERLAYVEANQFDEGSTASVSTPELVSVREGRPFSLGARVAGGVTGPVTYQWRLDGKPLKAQSGRWSSASGSLNGMRLLVPAALPSSAGIYDVVISNAFGSTVSAPLRVFVDINPVILRQPGSTTASEGGSATFRVEVAGSELYYRWLLGGSPDFKESDGLLVGTAPVLTFEALKVDLNGRYVRVIVTKGTQSDAPRVVSQTARLNVTRAGDLKIGDLQFDGLTASGVASPGSLVTIRTNVQGSGALSYQWRKDGIALPGIAAAGSLLNSGTLSLPVSVANDSGGVYDLVLTNGADIAYGKPASLAVDPFIEGFDVPAAVNPGDGLRLQVKASSPSGRSLKYQWSFRPTGASSSRNVVDDSNRITGANSDTLIVRNVSASDAGLYRVEVQFADSANLKVTLTREAAVSVSALEIVAHPQSLALNEGATGSLSVTAKDATAYRWFKDGTLLEGTSQPTLILSGTASTDGSFAAAGLYQVEVSNSSGTVLSRVATVTVNAGLRVEISGPSEVALGSSINLDLNTNATGSVTYAWTKDGKAVGNLPRLKISPALVSDSGTYRVTVTDSAGRTASAEKVLSVRNAPEILVGPATQAVASTGKAQLFVIARYAGKVRYQWFRNGTEISGSNRTSLNVSGADVASTGDRYTVRVSSEADPASFVEASATVSLRSTANPGSSAPSLNAGAFEKSKWWVYSVHAVSQQWSGAVRSTSGDRLGYWLVERVENGTTGLPSMGRSVWIWASGTDAWTREQQTPIEAWETERSEFSVVASREGAGGLETFVLSGRFETGGSASVYGAAEELSGESEGSVLYDLDLAWAGLETAELQGLATQEEAIAALRGFLGGSAASETPVGE